MRALKLLVAVLTILIIVGFGVLIWGLIRQAGKLSEPPEAGAPPIAPAVVSDERTPWQRLLLQEPPGTRIAGVTSAGDLLIIQLHTNGPGQGERLVVIDPGSGTLLGTIAIGP